MIELPRKKKAVEAEKIEEEIVEEEPIPSFSPAIQVMEDTKTDEELTEEVKTAVFKPEPIIVSTKKEEKLAKGMVKVRVLVGTLKFDELTYEKGDVFTVSKKRTEGFDPRFFEIIK